MNERCRNRVGGAPRLALATVAVAVAWPASALASSIELDFGTQRPGAPTAMDLQIAYTNPQDPNAKPPPIRHLAIDAPRGTSFDAAMVPVCEASDSELMTSGPGACPEQSKIGDGPIVVLTGFGPPFDPFTSPTDVFNDGKGWLEVSQDTSESQVIAVTRLAVAGTRISGEIGATPGGPPDGQSAVSTADLHFPAPSGYVTTPAVCPRDGLWKTTGTYRFGDGTSEVVHDETPCVRNVPRIHPRVRPAEIEAGETAAVTVALASRHGCAADAEVRIGKRPPLSANGAGRATLTAVFRRPGPRPVTASNQGCRDGRATLLVRP
jgi:hypothetical protein